jgi:cobalt/nickel transport protein
MAARTLALGFILLALTLSLPAHAHFGMAIPNHSMPADEIKAVDILFSFSHPFEGVGMDLARPKAAGVIVDGKRTDLELTKAQVMGHPAFAARHVIKRPGAHIVFMEPQPYWEPAEDAWIIHYTKTVVAAWNDDEGWDQPVGLRTEIVPLSRPLGLYAGNIFQGQVILDGKPVPHSVVEVEFYNTAGRYAAPSELMVTQTVKADANGVFIYAAPWSGWWGFAALNPAPFTLPHKGEPKEVELGAVIWVEFKDPVRK